VSHKSFFQPSAVLQGKAKEELGEVSLCTWPVGSCSEDVDLLPALPNGRERDCHPPAVCLLQAISLADGQQYIMCELGKPALQKCSQPPVRGPQG
jgi:hypothetical protein